MENNDLIAKAVAYIRENAIHADITVDEVATNAGFSIDYFNRIFQAHTGFTIMNYINHIRLKRAAALLRNTEQTLLDIALDVGYDSHEGFTKAFKKKYGLPPKEYRTKAKGKILSLGEIADPTTVSLFLYKHPELQRLDACDTINKLLELDSIHYAYFCAKIKYLGLTPAILKNAPQKGLLAIGDSRKGNCTLDLFVETLDSIADWISAFPEIRSIYSLSDPSAVINSLKHKSAENNFSAIPCSFCFSCIPEEKLPEGITIRQLNGTDAAAVTKWAIGQNSLYTQHLLSKSYYEDPAVLEYGVFKQEELIAVASCGIDDVQEFVFNDCCVIRFSENIASDELYRSIYIYITNDLINRGILPFDNIQHGRYANEHGDFYATDLGFKTVGWEYILTTK